MYEVTWNKETNQFRASGSDSQPLVQSTRATFFRGKGRPINSQDNEVFTGDFSFSKRSGLAILATEEGTLYVGAWSDD